MLNYTLKRLLALVPIIIGVVIAIFMLVHLVPGNPAQTMLGERATPEAIKALSEKMGLNDPLYIQFLRYVKKLTRGDLGRSIINNELVLAEIALRFPATFELTFFGMLFAVIIGIPLGIASSTHHNSWFDNFSMVGALVGVSMPIFWLGLMLIWFFAVILHILPPSARLSVDVSFSPITNIYTLDSIIQWNLVAFIDVVKHLILPSIVMGTIPLAIIARITRSSMLEVLKTDYIRTAYAKGLKEKIIVYKHAFRNALIPIVTVIGLQFGLLLGGAVLTETIFSWPGLGKFLLNGIYARDFPVVQGVVLFFSIIFVLVNLLVDLSYVYIDPRIKF